MNQNEGRHVGTSGIRVQRGVKAAVEAVMFASVGGVVLAIPCASIANTSRWWSAASRGELEEVADDLGREDADALGHQREAWSSFIAFAMAMVPEDVAEAWAWSNVLVRTFADLEDLRAQGRGRAENKDGPDFRQARLLNVPGRL